MLGWLYRVLIGSFDTCEHQWEYLKTTNHYESESSPLPYKIVMHYRCMKCLKHKTIASE